MAKSLHAQGLYKGKVISWGFGLSSGNHGFRMEFELFGRIEKCNPDQLLDGPKDTVFYRKPLVGGAVQWLLSDMRSLGYMGEDFTGLSPNSANAHNFEGAVATLECKHKEYEGQQQAEWRIYSDPLKLKPVDVNHVAQLNLQFSKDLKDHKDHLAKRSIMSATEIGPSPSTNGIDHGKQAAARSATEQS